MVTYLVRLTVDGEHEEQTVLANDSLHAARQALTLWWHVEPKADTVISVRALRPDPAEPYEPRRSLAFPEVPTIGSRRG